MTPDDALTPEGFQAVLTETLEKEISVYPARAWYPSSIGHPCDRFLVFDRTRWQEKRRHGATLQAIFGEGRLHQPAVYQRLEAMGFKIIRESDRPTQWKVGNGAVISGRIDGKVIGFRGEKYDPPRLLEIKSASGWSFDKLSTVDDLRKAPEHYIRSYYAQIQLCMLLENMPLGLIVIKSKATGMLKSIPLELDLGYAELLLQRIERLHLMVLDLIEPEPIPYDSRICGECGYNGICWPPRSMGDGVQILEDPALLEDLEAREALKASADRYAELDKSVKARVRDAGQALCGPYEIRTQERHVKEYTVPARTDRVVSIRRLE